MTLEQAQAVVDATVKRLDAQAAKLNREGAHIAASMEACKALGAAMVGVELAKWELELGHIRQWGTTSKGLAAVRDGMKAEIERRLKQGGGE